MTKLGYYESFWTTLVGNDWKSTEQLKFSIPNHFRPLWWEKMGKSAEWPKLVVLDHFGLLWCEKIGKSQK